MKQAELYAGFATEFNFDLLLEKRKGQSLSVLPFI
jgi:hypothetical protein